MERTLHDARQKIKEWQLRAQRLEAEKAEVEHEKTTLQELAERSAKAENESTLTIGKLQSQQDVLRVELLKRDRGLGLWRTREKEYQSQIRALRDRIDEMSTIIRQRESDFEKYKEKQHRFRERIDALNTTVTPITRKKHDRSLTDPSSRQLPLIKQGSSKNLIHLARLPSLVVMPRPPADGAPDASGPVRSRPRAMIDVASLPKSRLPPLIQSKKLPSSRSDKPIFAALLKAEIPEKGDVPLKCIMAEKWIDRKGGDIDLGKVALHIPPNSVMSPVLITITETDHKEARTQQIKEAGLQSYMQPGRQVRLQPHGQRFLRPIYMEMKGAKVNGPGKLLIFHKEVDVHSDSEWNDVTEEVKPTIRKDDVIISIDRFSIIETMRLLVPVVSLAAGMAIGYNISLLKTHARAMLNAQKSPCEFHVFHRERDPCLLAVCLGQDQPNKKVNINDRMSSLSGFKYLGFQSSRFELCDGERLLFYFDKSPDLAASFIFDYEACRTKGQQFQIPLGKGKGSETVYPEMLLVKRRVAEQLDDVILCQAYLNDVSKGKGLDEPDGAEAEEPWEDVLRSHRVDIVKSLDVRDVMDLMRQCKVFNQQEQEEIRALPSQRDRASAFIDRLCVKGQKGFEVFCDALFDDYEDLSRMLKKDYCITAT